MVLMMDWKQIFERRHDVQKFRFGATSVCIQHLFCEHTCFRPDPKGRCELNSIETNRWASLWHSLSDFFLTVHLLPRTYSSFTCFRTFPVALCLFSRSMVFSCIEYWGENWVTHTHTHTHTFQRRHTDTHVWVRCLSCRPEEMGESEIASVESGTLT